MPTLCEMITNKIQTALTSAFGEKAAVISSCEIANHLLQVRTILPDAQRETVQRAAREALSEIQDGIVIGFNIIGNDEPASAPALAALMI